MTCSVRSFCIYISIFVFNLHFPYCQSSDVSLSLTYVTELSSDNFPDIRKTARLVFVVFCAEWCPYSQRLKPIFHEAAKTWFTNNVNSNVVWGTIDSDSQSQLSSQFGVKKYPTLKVFINGELMPYEYRSSRSVEELNKFVAEQLKSTVKEFVSVKILNQNLITDKRNIIAHITCNNCLFRSNFEKLASILRKDCEFWLAIGQALSGVLEDSLVFKDSNGVEDQKFTGNLEDYEYMKSWLIDKCVSLVREVTFDNVEELSEKNVPFLVFFRDPKDKESEKLFIDTVMRELPDQRSFINPLLADGFIFAHPLKHLGKSSKDLPVLAIDSFQHMFVFENMADLPIPGKLRQFVLDLHSGKLHTMFHETLNQKIADIKNSNDVIEQLSMDVEQVEELFVQQTQKTTPPKSIFKELKPSGKRYSILEKQEL